MTRVDGLQDIKHVPQNQQPIRVSEFIDTPNLSAQKLLVASATRDMLRNQQVAFSTDDFDLAFYVGRLSRDADASGEGMPRGSEHLFFENAAYVCGHLDDLSARRTLGEQVNLTGAGGIRLPELLHDNVLAYIGLERALQLTRNVKDAEPGDVTLKRTDGGLLRSNEREQLSPPLQQPHSAAVPDASCLCAASCAPQQKQRLLQTDLRPHELLLVPEQFAERYARVAAAGVQLLPQYGEAGGGVRRP